MRMKTIDFLRDKGVDVDTAVQNMMDVDTYNEMLDDYYNDLNNNLNTLEGYKNSGDLANYAILVHAMKSNARSFGFMKLGEVCYNHEMASKANDINYVNSNFEKVRNNVLEVYNMITEYIN